MIKCEMFSVHIRLLNNSNRLVQHLETKRYEKDVRLPDTRVTNEDNLIEMRKLWSKFYRFSDN